jgi:hypothetical protein
MLTNPKKINFEDVSVVMISMNEEGAIKNVLQDISKDVPGAEVVLVDSSKDKTISSYWLRPRHDARIEKRIKSDYCDS